MKAGAGYAETIKPVVRNHNSGQHLPMASMWNGKIKRTMTKIPALDIGKCTDCDSCLEMCPEVFVRNSETGYIEVLDLPEYPEEVIDQIISICPADCISWEEN